MALVRLAACLFFSIAACDGGIPIVAIEPETVSGSDEAASQTSTTDSLSSEKILAAVPLGESSAERKSGPAPALEEEAPATSSEWFDPQAAWQLVESSASNPKIFTQGLELHGNRLYQSSGLYQKSFLQHRPFPAPDRSISPQGELHPSLVVRGGVQRNRFAEGLTVFNGELFLLTWRSGDVFLYNPDTLAPQGKLTVYGEGWGLTNDGESLIMSNGSEELRWLNPKNLKIRKRVKVKNADGSPEKSLNELEYINGEVFANVWGSDKIVRIDPESGQILQTLDMAKLWPKEQRTRAADVLNGIAWDPRSASLLVTGKRWPTLYRVKLRDAPGSLLANK